MLPVWLRQEEIQPCLSHWLTSYRGRSLLCHSPSHTDVLTLQKGKKAGWPRLQDQVSYTKQLKVRTQASRADERAQQEKELATKPDNMSSILGSA